ncbi:hypothetical protein QN277_000722 [Acacia crassicarpa]|uniref:Uncharacterized protein n=1 Tax=Acacia crassicarpa TaxID=499986 RepID=A0AAE1N725_9FABA|nr:hypothetical protein QN277_000722 [Acacia crassicarpa]
MQMQWEILWFEYVKESMPPYFISQPNKKGETPGEIFTNEHMNLINDCDNTVKDMCGSYMVASTLVTGSSFSKGTTQRFPSEFTTEALFRHYFIPCLAYINVGFFLCCTIP